MNVIVENDFNDENVNHLEPTGLKITGSNGKPVKLYKFIGSTSGKEWESVKDYFLYVSPEFVLRNGVTGFRDYGDIGWYCKHKDLFIVEQRLNVPLHLTVGYLERIKRSEASEWYSVMREQRDDFKSKINEIKHWFTEAVYPESVRDYLSDIILTSRIYLPDKSNFFDEGSVAFIIREDQDFIAMFVNLEFNRGMGNCRGVLDGIFCYLDFDPELADLINDWCMDSTDDFRTLFVKAKDHYAFHHHPRMFFEEPHKFHSGCTKKKPWEYDLPHY